MAKQTTPLPLVLPRAMGQGATRWLYDAIREAILEGRLAPGVRLPATRQIARDYGLARGTVVEAFEQLKAEGYVQSRPGSGTYVSRELPDRLIEVDHRPAEAVPARPTRRLSGLAGRAVPFRIFTGRRVRPFLANQPALDQFPTTLWARVAARRYRMATMDDLRGTIPFGFLPLRRAVAAYLTTSRGVRCTPEQVAIVSGVQEALSLTLSLVINPGDRVAIEDPGYPGALRLAEAMGARVVRCPVDAEGLRLDARRMKGVRLVYVTPAHQYPLGVTMSIGRRLALLEWARDTGALILEDDYDSEYRYRGQPIAALQGLDRHGVTIFAGSFNKVLFPSLRLGYLVLPPDLIEPASAIQSLTTRHAPLLDQVILADFINDGHFGRHLRRMRQLYAERWALFMERAEAELEGLLSIARIEAGLQTVGALSPGVSAHDVVRAAAERDLELMALPRAGAMATDHVMLGFAAIDSRQIARGMRDLAAVVRRAALNPGSPV